MRVKELFLATEGWRAPIFTIVAGLFISIGYSVYDHFRVPSVSEVQAREKWVQEGILRKRFRDLYYRGGFDRVLARLRRHPTEENILDFRKKQQEKIDLAIEFVKVVRSIEAKHSEASKYKFDNNYWLALALKNYPIDVTFSDQEWEAFGVPQDGVEKKLKRDA